MGYVGTVVSHVLFNYCKELDFFFPQTVYLSGFPLRKKRIKEEGVHSSFVDFSKDQIALYLFWDLLKFMTTRLPSV